MQRLAVLFIALIATAPTWAAEPAGGSPLNLNLPQSSDYQYRNDPPGTWYGDRSGKPTAQEADSAEDRCKGELHGSVSAGAGYSSRGGNSNWQAVSLNSCKTFYSDDGDAHQVGISINLGQYDGPGGRLNGPRLPPMRGPRR